MQNYFGKKSVKKKEREQIPFMIQMIIDHQLKQEGNLKKENASFVWYILYSVGAVSIVGGTSKELRKQNIVFPHTPNFYFS